MKRLILLFCFVLTAFPLLQSQNTQRGGSGRATGEAINIQGVARDIGYMPLANLDFRIRATILDDKQQQLYIESKIIQTNTIGVFTYNLGTGDSEFGNYDEVNWKDAFSLSLEADFTAGTNYSHFGSLDLQYVPKAHQANEADIALEAEMAFEAILAQTALIADVAMTAESFDEKQELQFDLRSGATGQEGVLTITNFSSEHILPDLDPENELQTISFDSATQTLSVTDPNAQHNHQVQINVNGGSSPWLIIPSGIKYGEGDNTFKFNNNTGTFLMEYLGYGEVFIDRTGIYFDDYFDPASSFSLGVNLDGKSELSVEEVLTETILARTICADTIKVKEGIFTYDEPSQKSILRATQSYFTEMSIRYDPNSPLSKTLRADPDYLYKEWLMGDDLVKQEIEKYVAGIFAVETLNGFGGIVSKEILSQHGSRLVRYGENGNAQTSVGYNEDEPECGQLAVHGKNGAIAAAIQAAINPTNITLPWGLMWANSFVVRNNGGATVGQFRHDEVMGGSVINCFYLFGSVKNFVEQHPVEEDKKIVYASLEGPEAGMYNRGKAVLINGEAFVEYEEHFRLMLAEGTETITLTPRSADTYGLAVIKTTNEGFFVKELMKGTGNFEFDWRVDAVRKGFENYRVIRDEESLNYQTEQEFARYQASKNQ